MKSLLLFFIVINFCNAQDKKIKVAVHKNTYLKEGPHFLEDNILQFKENDSVYISFSTEDYIPAEFQEKKGFISKFDFKKSYEYLEIEKKYNDSISIINKQKKIAEEEKIEKEKIAHEQKILKKYGATTFKKLKEGYYWIGMNKEMAEFSLGSPKDINKNVGSWGTHEQWIYDNLYLYFENNILKSYQN